MQYATVSCIFKGRNIIGSSMSDPLFRNYLLEKDTLVRVIASRLFPFILQTPDSQLQLQPIIILLLPQNPGYYAAKAQKFVKNVHFCTCVSSIKWNIWVLREPTDRPVKSYGWWRKGPIIQRLQVWKSILLPNDWPVFSAQSQIYHTRLTT